MNNETKLKNPLQLLKEALRGYKRNAFLLYLVIMMMGALLIGLLFIGPSFISFYIYNDYLLVQLFLLTIIPSIGITSLLLFAISYVHERNIYLALKGVKNIVLNCFWLFLFMCLLFSLIFF